MSFPVALQSAIFYLVACTPCAKVRHRQKARDIAKKERLEKAKLETEQPGLYRHPSPFNTNPYWQEEIDMGPSLPKKSVSKNSSQRGLTSSSDRESQAPSMSEHINVGDSFSITRVDEEDIPSDWNRKKGYQREDEELWGQWSGHKIKDALSKAKDSAGRLVESALGNKEVSEQERRAFYTTPRNPPVNDFHPPVVSSKPAHKDAHKWMLQPPPSAKVMEGKIPVSRAVSSGSKSSGMTLVGEDASMSRTTSEKKRNEPTESELIDSLFVTRSNQTIPRSRSMSFDRSDDTLENHYERRRTPRMRPLAVPPGWDADDDDVDPIAAPPMAKTLSNSLTVNHAAQRPKLETIPSTDAAGANRELSKKTKKSRSKRTRLDATSPVGDDSD
ncbi:hypothetical protein VHEMI06335 [[Torrubiella] hemipterigena]|uniref:Signal peptide-containing protein n=1 Tax=[Torrubiella] hemipterigena TaxID=1531966 RepID=A0A0A1T6Y8_9HYPO|nr:hypothetical protein VHEMI06335 [[Torrubiella] hemipterigena]